MKKKLVKVCEIELDIVLDIKYATNDNFTNKKVYNRSEYFLHPVAYEHLTLTIDIAMKIGYKLKIFDGFRPKESQQKLWDFLPSEDFLASPEKGSPHSRGAAIDLTLIDKNNIELDMGTEFDEFSKLSFHGSKSISAEAFKNRSILLGLMTASGWDFFRNEWRHYQLFHSKKYPLLSDKDIKDPLTL